MPKAPLRLNDSFPRAKKVLDNAEQAQVFDQEQLAYLRALINAIQEDSQIVTKRSFMTVAEVAALQKVHVDTVRGWCRAGELISYKFQGTYRVTPKAYQDFLNRKNTGYPFTKKNEKDAA